MPPKDTGDPGQRSCTSARGHRVRQLYLGKQTSFFFFILFLAFFCCFLRAERSEVQDDFSAAPSPARLQRKNKTWGANPTRCCGASKQRAGSTTPKSNYGISVVFIRTIDARSWESFLGGRKQDIDF